MLTADLVRARKANGELVLRPLTAKERPRALEIASAYLDVLARGVGKRREQIQDDWAAVPIAAREKRLADGLKKLAEDASEFAPQSTLDPAELRSAVFLAASAARHATEDRFDRAAVLAKIAEERGIGPEVLEQGLYADLRSEEVLLRAPSIAADALLARYESGQVQAVLLRAVRVVADVDCATPSAYRALFRELKFRRLLHRTIARPEGGYRLEIDGPYSLFESVTKYGLELALVLPALEACDSLRLVAEVRWGKTRTPLAFRHEKLGGTEKRRRDAPRLRDDVAALAEAVSGAGSPWTARESNELLELPGVGLCVPDLLFEHANGQRVYFEALGFWSRDAVWKRVELVRAGLAAPTLFAVSSRLRVSEAVLDETEPAALYVYKGTMSARAVLRKLDQLAGRAR